MNWYILTFISLVFFGIQKFLFKVSAERGYSSRNVTLAFMLSVAIIGMTGHFIFYPADPIFTSHSLILSFINGSLFLTLTLIRLKALKLAPSMVVMPLFDLSFLIMFPISVWLFHDTFTSLQVVGIFLGVLALLFLIKRENQEHNKYPLFIYGIMAAVAAMVISVLLNILSKYVAISQVSKMSFIGLSYTINTVLLLGTHGFDKIKGKTRGKAENRNGEVLFGVLIGIVNFTAFFSSLNALQTGSVALVGIILSFSSTVAILLSVLIYHEKITWQRVAGILLSVISLILMK